MAFCLKILGGAGDLRIVDLLDNEYSLSDGDNWEVVGILKP